MRFTHLLLVSTAVGAWWPGVALHAQDDRQRVDTTYAFDRGGSLSLEIVSGEIRVVAGPTNQIRIVASIERGRFETSFSRSRASVEARSVNGRMGNTRIEVTVPLGTRVRATSVSGLITVSGTQDEVEASTISGAVTVSDAAKMIRLGTVSGSVELERSSGRLEVSSVSGQVRAVGVSGDFGVESVSGRVSIRDARIRTLRASSVSGEVSYEGSFDRTGDYRFNSHSGSLLLSLPANAGASLDVETFSGRISSDFPITLQPGESSARRNRRMHFTLGDGATRISAETFSGNITIRRAVSRDDQE